MAAFDQGVADEDEVEPYPLVHEYIARQGIENCVRGISLVKFFT